MTYPRAPSRNAFLNTCFMLLVLAGLAGQEAKAEHSKLLSEASQGGYVLLLRHALAPGFGDPNDFSLQDCATQRNLSAEGREQAGMIGAMLREHQLTDVSVYSSEWCRCRDTARLLDLGPVTPLAVLNSFFAVPERREEQTAALQIWLQQQGLDKTLILVTHQVNISAMANVYPASGEVIVLRRDGNEFRLAGRVSPPPVPEAVW